MTSDGTVATSASAEGVRDPHDPRAARNAVGLLRTFTDAGVLDAADVHVATALADLGGEPDLRLRLAAALAVRAVRLGSVCVDLATVHLTVGAAEAGPAAGDPRPGGQSLDWPDPAEWLAAVRSSALVDANPVGTESVQVRPLRVSGSLLYLDRYWREEESVRAHLDDRGSRWLPVPDLDRAAESLDRLFTDPHAGRQRLAVGLCALSPIVVIAGGPGTGKTSTVARLLAVLADQPGAVPRIALAAPTGRAAARLQEAVAASLTDPVISSDVRTVLAGVTASTIHRLLVWLPGTGGRFRHHRGNRLPHDVVVIDETSMVSLTLMSRLLDAVRPDARLVLVGDPDQLASVEAGAVLADIVARQPAPASTSSSAILARITRLRGGDTDSPDEAAPRPADTVDPADPADPADLVDVVGRRVVRLEHAFRFTADTAIPALADAIRRGDVDQTLALLAHPGRGVEFVATEANTLGAADSVRPDITTAARTVVEAARSGDATSALAAMTSHRVLCAHRDGPAGALRWSTAIEGWLRAASPGYGAEGEWSIGRVVILTANDYDLGLFNGDTGVVIAGPAGTPVVVFAASDGERVVAPSRLATVVAAHAVTVHRAQGSQFDGVSVVLPGPESPILTRELLYTALTRARSRVRVVGSLEAVAAAVGRPVTRASGLRVPRPALSAASHDVVAS